MEEEEIIVAHHGYSEYWYVNYNGDKSCTKCWRIISEDKCPKCFNPPPPPITIPATPDLIDGEKSENNA